MPNNIDLVRESKVEFEQRDIKFFKALAWIAFILLIIRLLIG